MEYGLPQDYYNEKFDSKLRREHRYRRYENSGYALGMPSVPVGVVVAGIPLPDPQIFFTEPKIRDVKTFVKTTENLTINISGDPDKINQIIEFIKSLEDE